MGESEAGDGLRRIGAMAWGKIRKGRGGNRVVDRNGSRIGVGFVDYVGSHLLRFWITTFVYTPSFRWLGVLLKTKGIFVFLRIVEKLDYIVRRYKPASENPSSETVLRERRSPCTMEVGEILYHDQ